MLARQTQIGIQNPVFRLGVADVSQEFRVQTNRDIRLATPFVLRLFLLWQSLAVLVQPTK